MAEKKAPKLGFYKNTSKANIFTENGRCMPEATIKLTSAQAKPYKGLELCKTKS